MALFDDMTDGLKKVLLASVGAVAMGAEKSQEVVDDLIKKGELTVDQGKKLNEELSRKIKETTDAASDEVLKVKLRAMKPEEREAWLVSAQKMIEDIAAEEAAAAAEAEAAEQEAEYVVEDEATAEATEDDEA